MASFGRVPSLAPNPAAVRLLRADPENACGGLNAEVATPGSSPVYLVLRGNCSFLDKALAVQAAGGSGMLLYDSVPGCVNMGFDAGDATAAAVNITAVSITHQVSGRTAHDPIPLLAIKFNCRSAKRVE